MEMLHSGRYSIDFPENGALMIVLYLLEKGKEAEAKSILEQIRPWFDKLRFYPYPAEVLLLPLLLLLLLLLLFLGFDLLLFFFPS